MNGLMHCNKIGTYSITSSVRARTEIGTSRPSAFAVLRLITNSNLVAYWIGRSAVFSESGDIAARVR
jgi:hypothetical protein